MTYLFIIVTFVLYALFGIYIFSKKVAGLFGSDRGEVLGHQALHLFLVVCVLSLSCIIFSG